ncbi:MAG: YdeI/OmpD-associated family protein [Vicinamibacterales bacterium]
MAPASKLKTFVARTADEWRRWLAEHHHSESEVWLIFYKRHSGQPTIGRSEALDEALCFGWIDSLIRRIDASRYAIKFTPRRVDSRWSAINRRRYAALKTAGRLQPPGLERPPTERTYDVPVRRPLSTIPSYIKDALRKRAVVWRRFEALAPFERRQYVLWIDSAKRQETKMRRLTEVLQCLAKGKPLGLK